MCEGLRFGEGGRLLLQQVCRALRVVPRQRVGTVIQCERATIPEDILVCNTKEWAGRTRGQNNNSVC